ncbi:MAG: TonB-dependent siderophore receptor [Microcoleus sp. SU_5_3]|nr:TonB-dependent siderophore receptor [Microcoleus sp. SU_5_3]
MSRVGDHQQPATTVKDWLVQIEAAQVQVTNVKLERTETRLDIILETAEGKPLQVDATQFRSEGNSLIAEIPNATLALPQGQPFVAENPMADITTVQVVQQEGGTIRVNVVGNNALPKTEVTLKTGGLVYSLNPETEEAETEIVVTAEKVEEGYRVPNTSVGTRTDTPLRDIPQSIQVVPQEVLRDQQATRLEDSLRNVPSVSQSFNFSGAITFYHIRGFEVNSTNFLRDGLLDPTAPAAELFSIEQVEVLKGPASVLFGSGAPGGSINFVTKRPLRDPFYAIDATIGSYSFYQGAVDLSGPLNDSKTALYRLNAAYGNAGSFVDFSNREYLSVSPVVSIDIGKNTNLSLEGDYIYKSNAHESGVPPVGSTLPNPNGKIPRNSNFGEPSDTIDQTFGSIGYRLEHKFSDNWSLRNAFRVNFGNYYERKFNPISLDADNRTLLRDVEEFGNNPRNYILTTNLVGKFFTGSIQHQLLFGVDLTRRESQSSVSRTFAAPSIDIFNPVYGQERGEITSDGAFFSLTDSLGIYLQDQIALTDNLKVLLGGRFDAFTQTSGSEDFIEGTESSDSLSDSAISPRFGIVYQPIKPISLYASYSRSFVPSEGRSRTGSTFKPEQGTQYEIGIKTDITDSLSLTLAAFDITRSNVLVPDPDDEDFSIQTGEQKSQGIELNLGSEILPGWNIIAGYAYTDARVTKDTTIKPGTQLPEAPRNSFNLWTTYEIQSGQFQGLGFGLGLFYVSDRPTAFVESPVIIPGHLRTDAVIFYKRDRLRLALNIENLFDVEYFEFGSRRGYPYYGQPFTVKGTISWEF